MEKSKKIIIGAACAAVLLAGVGAGCYVYTQQESSAKQQTELTTEEPTTTEALTEAVTEPPTEKETEPPTTTEPETTEPEEETGSIKTGELPASADDLIILEDADKFFENSVFIGDSVMMGFRNYVMKQPEGFLGGPQFLVSGSFSVRMALVKISEKTIHPIYQGEQRYIWDSISMMGAEKVFLFFGLNDIDMEGVDGTFENYVEVMDKIREVNQEAEIFVISTTNVLIGSEKGGLNNDNIDLLNEKLREYCETAEADYIDIAGFLKDEAGGLKEEYCSDAYVHQTSAAYEVWAKVLRCYASGGNYMLSKEPETSEVTEEQSAETTASVETIAAQETTVVPETTKADN